eukprot:6386190-Alexandrium_andersonii.AAC.1
MLIDEKPFDGGDPRAAKGTEVRELMLTRWWPWMGARRAVRPCWRLPAQRAGGVAHGAGR